LSKYAHMAYAEGSTLRFASRELSSESGVQQGDPVGPLLFSLVLLEVVGAITARCPDLDLNVWFLDDGTLAGPCEAVARTVAAIEEVGAGLGLRLSHSGKCEAIWPHERQHSSLPDYFSHRENGEIDLLGSPIGSGEFCQEYLHKLLREEEDPSS
jgi:hypothetical protein